MSIDHHQIIAAALSAVLSRSVPLALNRPEWRTLPGNIMELGSTGFQIRFSPTPLHDLQLFNPEGVVLCTGRDFHLPDIKRQAELCASSRAEFAAAALKGDFNV